MPGRPRSILLAVVAAAALAAGACGAPRQPAPAGPSAPPDILLVTIDTLRADRVGRGFTPTLDHLASEGLSFTEARSAVPLTLPSHATILSGLLPPHHGVRENATYHFDPAHPTVASLLRARGYRTAAVVGAFVLDRQFGLDAGFDSYDDRIPRNPDADTKLESERRATAVTDAALAWLDSGRPSPAAPFFLWVHYYDPHAPYDPPPAFAARANGDRYGGEVAYVDAELARLLDGLSSRHLAGRLAVVVAGDHGESLGEHGERTHGMMLYEAAVRVPLVVRAPGAVRPATRNDPASLADVAPTLLALAGVPAVKGMDGTSLLGKPLPGDREVYAETNYPRAAGWVPQRSLVTPPWKLVQSSPIELYDTARDPGETRNLAGERAAMAAAMAARLREFESAPSAAPAAPTAEAQERLRALGYVAASPGAQADPSARGPAREIAAWGDFEDALSDVASGRSAAALPRLKRLASRYASAQVFRKAYAQALLDAGRPADALSEFRGLVSRWHGDAALLHDLGVAARAAGRDGEATRAEQAALVVDSKYPAAHNGLGLLQAEAGHFGDAAASFEKAASLEPSNPSYLTNLGNARRDAGDGPRAADAYRRALAIDGGWPDAANGLGVVLVQDGKPAEAVAWFEKALARAPGLVEARLNLGIALQEAGQTSRARAAYREVLNAPARYRQQREAAAKLLGQLR